MSLGVYQLAENGTSKRGLGAACRPSREGFSSKRRTRSSVRPRPVCSFDAGDDQIAPIDPDDERWEALAPEDDPYGPLPEPGDFWIDADGEEGRLSDAKSAA